MQLPNENSDSGDTGRNSAEFSVAHSLALNLEAVFNLTMNDALGEGEGEEAWWQGRQGEIEIQRERHWQGVHLKSCRDCGKVV